MDKVSLGAIITDGGNSKKNKTGSWATKRAFIDQKKCIKCHTCVLFCPEDCINIKENGKDVEVDADYCKGCLVCVNECPVKAISVTIQS